MAEGAERRPIVSAFRIIDDTLGEIGLPGPLDVLPSPSEVFHALGLPTLDDMGESLKAKIGGKVGEKRAGLFG